MAASRFAINMIGALLILLVAERRTAAAVVVVNVDWKRPPPAELTEKLSPHLLATVRSRGHFVGITLDGQAAIEPPAGLDLERMRARLAPLGTLVTVGAQPQNPEFDRIEQLLVFFNHGDPPALGTDLAGLKVVKRHRLGRFAVVESSGPIAALTLRKLERHPRVRFVEPNYKYRLSQGPAPSPSAPPNDPDYLQGKYWSLAKINAPTAWTSVHDSPVRVAILDTGIALGHRDIAPNLWTNDDEVAGTAGVDDDCNGCIDDVHGCDFYQPNTAPEDDIGHGTMVAGIVAAAGDNHEFGVGVAWHLELIAVRVVDQGFKTVDQTVLIDATDYAVASGARIINMSLGGVRAYGEGLSNAITRAGTYGALIVAAAGNQPGKDMDATGDLFYPAAFSHENIIAVLGTSSADEVIAVSNWGPVSVDLGAPGEGITSTTLSGMKSYESGTSYATPHVSGALALVWGKWPNLSAKEARDKLLTNVTSAAGLSGKCSSGGRLDLKFLQ